MSTEMNVHIRLDDGNVAWIDDTNTKVIEVVLDTVAHGWSPEEIHFQHPHLSLAQIHAALSFYHDNKEQLDQEIKVRRDNVGDLQNASPESPIRKRIRELRGAA